MSMQLHEVFTDALASLPPVERQLLRMYEDGATTATVSGALGITRSEARVTLFSARRAMRLTLTDRLRNGGTLG
jgi:DNA-directed RNA polymerase specialized sigma24 family protein